MIETESPAILSVSDLTQRIKARLESDFPEVWVEGEISNFRAHTSGHLYLTLKDADSQLKAVMFRSANRQLRFAPKDGLQVVCRGRVSVYDVRGEYQLVVELMEPKGLGALQLAFEQLKARLEAEGLFDPARKRPLPALPRCIGVVTSPTGAAIKDILNVLSRRFANVRVLINPVSVQGEGSAEQIARAIDEFNEMEEQPEVLIVGRGGGSLEDLWAFNEEVVARAIYRSRIPIISAVGHEIDFTIADFVADLRAATPSAAAEIVIKSKTELVERIRVQTSVLIQCIHRRLEGARGDLKGQTAAMRDPRTVIETFQLRVDDFMERMTQGIVTTIRHHRLRLGQNQEGLRHRNPIERVARLSERLKAASERFVSGFRHDLVRRRGRFETAVGRLNSLSPLAILSRGYSIARLLPGLRVIRDARAIPVGSAVSVRLSRGSLTCEVKGVEETLL